MLLYQQNLIDSKMFYFIKIVRIIDKSTKFKSQKTFLKSQKVQISEIKVAMNIPRGTVSSIFSKLLPFGRDLQ